MASGNRSHVVVGAGVAGLTVASELAQVGPVVVIDRLPVIGGVAGFADARVRDACKTCEERGVQFILGGTALRWTGARVLVAGPVDIGWRAADHLVYAGGSRPSTLAELAISGDRTAGVLQAPVALHLLEAGVWLGERVVIIGSGDWARAVAAHLSDNGSTVVELPLPTQAASESSPWAGWRPAGIRGQPRAHEVVMSRGLYEERISCDAVVLAGGSTPLRNVDGAVVGGRAVSFVQPAADTQTVDSVISFSKARAEEIISSLEEREQ